VGYLKDVLSHKDTLVRGVTFILGGAALVLAGTLIGLNTTKVAQVAAGTIATTGVIVMFLGFFVYILPPLLPAK
jgi:hypothetical protein